MRAVIDGLPVITSEKFDKLTNVLLDPKRCSAHGNVRDGALAQATARLAAAKRCEPAGPGQVPLLLPHSAMLRCSCFGDGGDTSPTSSQSQQLPPWGLCR